MQRKIKLKPYFIIDINEIEPIYPDSDKLDILTIVPNPANDIIYLKGIESPADIWIYNITGQFILQKSKVTELDVSMLSGGIYIIQASINNRSKTIKLIKQ